MAEGGWRALWRFSLELYRRPGVEEACLRLQDGWGADVNLLLLCCWLERRGRRADRRLLRRAAAAVAAWRAQAVLPLRQVRRRLRGGPGGVPRGWSEPVRRAAQAAELQAEQVEQRLLFRCAASHRPRPPRPGPDGLERYRALLGAPAGGEAARHLETLRAAGSGPARRAAPPLPR